MMMTSLGFYDAAIDAVRSGKLDEAVLDDAVRHILTVKCRMNLLAQPEKSGRPGCIGCEEHQQTALRAARKSITLLKNDAHTLPLTSVRRVRSSVRARTTFARSTATGRTSRTPNSSRTVPPSAHM